MIFYVWAELAYLWCRVAFLLVPLRRGGAGELGALMASAAAWDRMRWCNRRGCA